MINAIGYAAQNAKASLSPFQFNRRELGNQDVLIEILYCGVCHSDIHQARNEWGGALYPMVPGHEIVGKVTRLGKNVKRFHVGDIVGVGCMVNSCKDCVSCKDSLEQFCESCVYTYNSFDRDTKEQTYGGYSNCIVVDEAFVLKVDSTLDSARVAPLLCAGITTYSPLKRWQAGPGKKVGIIGLGGLGHMGLQFARSFGAHVVLFTTSPGKEADAKRLGAHEVVISSQSTNMEKQANSFDLILDTVSAQHDINAYLNLLKRDGVLAVVGAPEKALELNVMNLLAPRRQIAGSLIGGIPETQAMLDYCAKHHILPEIELIPIQKINEAYERMLKNNVKYRFVIDLKSLSAN
jgi:uncharacterized zinc-type alcohol dehydrogenase-like protein